MTILVTGARGGIARNLITQLLEAGASVRVGSRDPQQARLPDGVEPALVDFAKPETLPAALAGVSKVFMYAAVDGIDNFVSAAREAGVEHVVLLSSSAVDAPSDDDNEISRMHRQAEAPLKASGITWTFIRPGMFASNALWWAQSIKEEGKVRVPYPDAVVNPIHEADMAAVAFAALTTSDHDNSVIYIDGPRPLTQRRQVELIAEAGGRQIEVEELPREVAEKFMPSIVLDMLAGGISPKSGPTAEAVTGTPARDFARWAADHAEDFR